MLRIYRLVLAFTLLGSLVSADLPLSEKSTYNCDSVSVESVLSSKKDGATEIKLNVTGAEKPVHYVFFLNNGKMLNTDARSNKLVTLEKGQINFAVKDGNGCTVKSNVLIE